MRTLNQDQWTGLAAGFSRYRLGDAQAARQVFGALLGPLRIYFRFRVPAPQDAEDLAQASLLKIHFSRDRYDESLSFKTWVYTVASRCLIDHWRSGKRRDALGLDADAAELAGELADETISFDLRWELGGALEQALSVLKPVDRAIVYLYGVEGLSMAEVAAIHQITPTAAKLRAHRAYVKLREQLK